MFAARIRGLRQPEGDEHGIGTFAAAQSFPKSQPEGVLILQLNVDADDADVSEGDEAKFGQFAGDPVSPVLRDDADVVEVTATTIMGYDGQTDESSLVLGDVPDVGVATMHW